MEFIRTHLRFTILLFFSLIPFSTASQAEDTSHLETAEITTSPAPIEVIQHTQKNRVFDSFVTNVWNQLGVCARCHSSRNANLEKWAEKYGPNIQWCLDTPEETFKVITEGGLADVDYPEESFILMKPTMQINHVGGQRMEVGDRRYKLFRRWLEDYAAVVNGEYESVDDFPTAPTIEFIGSRIFLELIQIPEQWVGKRVSVFIFLFDEATGKFFPRPVAEASARVLTTNKHWNRSLTLRGPKGSTQVQELKESHRLPEDRYLLKIFCDVNEELKEDWEIPLMDKRFYVGQLEITAHWRVRWKRAMIVNLSEL